MRSPCRKPSSEENCDRSAIPSTLSMTSPNSLTGFSVPLLPNTAHQHLPAGELARHSLSLRLLALSAMGGRSGFTNSVGVPALWRTPLCYEKREDRTQDPLPISQ